ncbi:ABC transporter ATP-binding protein [Reinekea forsetii]|nr:ABC transporter ATP-binding protein [Reinekea forsetii]
MLTFENLTLGYDRHPAVHHLNATIVEGDFIALVGPNGAGKSTLLKSILGQLTPIEGRVVFNGIGKNDISYLPQASAVDRTFPITAEQFVATGLWQELGAFGQVNKHHRERIHLALVKVGLAGLEHRTLDALSGGQFQRLLFARKLMQQARLLLLDEPFSGVDEQTVEDLMQVITDLHSDGATIVAVIHNLSLVRRYFPRALLLSRELIAMGDTAQVLTPDNLNRASSLGFADELDPEICAVHDHA